ncbi:hypothetical protein [uncultured Massilia sp.]|uniref:hypothetical protein n=1 Tax=uncultured Massilia sp. TaxID=169973 RepID=UPI0025D60F67|nr:hypothetical protein [uncultured Massilia sp.]
MMPNASGTSRYIIRTVHEGPVLAAFIAGIRTNPAVRLLEAIGPQQQPHTAVVETDAATAEQLRQSFSTSNQLMIEPDSPLSLFDRQAAL